ncbi:class I SAM-dependent methyltransferase [Mesorhizobium sp. 1M-11]|uniref:SAM-dependent methyltransferase n=1 Tax=Mesorhizobium sp. 1M-11 TaxID=1529006 RepID=UPI001FCCF3DD|nr:class I SAM-dependent methyltransferase [Mesorhizobium sp. 1M-11]
MLAVADGEGRNGVWLAERGLDVVSVDGSGVGLAKARALAHRRGVSLQTVLADLALWEWESEAYDVVVAIFVQFAPPDLRKTMFEGFHTCLKPGGILVMQGYRVEQLRYGTGGPPHADHLYTRDLLIRSFGHWEIRHLQEHDSVIEEGAGHSGMSALIDLVAEKARHDILPLPSVEAAQADLRIAARTSVCSQAGSLAAERTSYRPRNADAIQSSTSVSRSASPSRNRVITKWSTPDSESNSPLSGATASMQLIITSDGIRSSSSPAIMSTRPA